MNGFKTLKENINYKICIDSSHDNAIKITLSSNNTDNFENNKYLDTYMPSRTELAEYALKTQDYSIVYEESKKAESEFKNSNDFRELQHPINKYLLSKMEKFWNK